tara:strand:+ start:191 stop:559 length:369 start_codon:yes stop_codon:yes gene_type:complete
MGLRDKLNIKQSTKTTSNKNASVEHKLNQFCYNAMIKALKENKELSQYLVTLDNVDVFQQVKDDEVSVKSISGECIVIPNGKVSLKHNKNIETLNTSFKVGEFQTYIKGIKNQVCEFVKVVK